MARTSFYIPNQNRALQPGVVLLRIKCFGFFMWHLTLIRIDPSFMAKVEISRGGGGPKYRNLERGLWGKYYKIEDVGA